MDWREGLKNSRVFDCPPKARCNLIIIFMIFGELLGGDPQCLVTGKI